MRERREGREERAGERERGGAVGQKGTFCHKSMSHSGIAMNDDAAEVSERKIPG